MSKKTPRKTTSASKRKSKAVPPKKKSAKKKVATKKTAKKITKKKAAPRSANKILQLLIETYPDAVCSLRHVNSLELLIATILSAQCTDERVNIVTQTLFKKYRKASDYAKAPLEELEQDVKSTGFYRNKAKNIQECCRILDKKFGGQPPADLDELVALPGIGRKTANVVMGNAFGIASGVVVDTHVSRISQRLGLTTQKTPEKIEIDLNEIVPQDEWVAFSHRVIQHGRRTCKARKPQCDVCEFNKVCARVGVE
jgi:endonuclease III